MKFALVFAVVLLAALISVDALGIGYPLGLGGLGGLGGYSGYYGLGGLGGLGGFGGLGGPGVGGLGGVGLGAYPGLYGFGRR